MLFKENLTLFVLITYILTQNWQFPSFQGELVFYDNIEVNELDIKIFVNLFHILRIYFSDLDLILYIIYVLRG